MKPKYVEPGEVPSGQTVYLVVAIKDYRDTDILMAFLSKEAALDYAKMAAALPNFRWYDSVEVEELTLITKTAGLRVGA